MASSAISPIVIGSDDDDSDCDDVVVIKEEIEVDDGDDVIFLSETKPTKAPPPEVEGPEAGDSGEATQADEKDDQTGVNLTRNNSVCTSFSAQLSLSDSESQTGDSSVQSTVMAPLDLSSKVVRSNSDPTIGNPLQYSNATDLAQDSSSFQVLLGQDTVSNSTNGFQQAQTGCQNYSADSSGSKSLDLNFGASTSASDLIAQCFSQSTSDFMLGVSQAASSMVTPSVSQSGFNLMTQSFNQPASDVTSNTTQPQSFLNQSLGQMGSDWMLGYHFGQSGTSVHQGMSKPKSAVSPADNQSQSDPFSVLTVLNSGPPTSSSVSADTNNVNSSVLAPADSSVVTTSVAGSSVCNNSSTVGQSNSSASDIMAKIPVSSVSDTNTVPQSKPVIMDTSDDFFSVLLGSPTPSGSGTQSNNTDTGKSSDLFSDSHLLLSSLFDPMWPGSSTSTSDASNSSTQTGSTTDASVPTSASSASVSNHSTALVSGSSVRSPGLPGGSASSLTTSPNPPIPKIRIKISPTSVCKVNPLKRSVSLMDQKTYCKEKSALNRKVGQAKIATDDIRKKLRGLQKELRKLTHIPKFPSGVIGISNSSASACASTSVSAGINASSSASLPCSSVKHQLPPKKQKRCFSQNDYKSSPSPSVPVATHCACCSTNLTGEKFSRCPNGHASCAKCLEEKVKLVLTGKNKESVRCLSSSCDSFYPISELKHSLPPMVVEILEDKLDHDYVNYISDMILKNATGEVTQNPVAGPSTAEDLLPLPPPPKFMKQSSIDADLPENWEPMEDTEGYRMVDLDPSSDEYNEILLKFYESMMDRKIDVVCIKRVQNPIQWKFYKVKKMQMLQDNDGFTGAINELKLFHGTSTSVVEAICKKGFDWRVCGKNGTLYGQGSYFAVNASYSHQYTDIKERRKQHMHLHSIPNMSSTYFNFSPVVSAQPFQQMPPIPTALNLSQNPPPTAGPPPAPQPMPSGATTTGQMLKYPPLYVNVPSTSNSNTQSNSAQSTSSTSRSTFHHRNCIRLQRLRMARQLANLNGMLSASGPGMSTSGSSLSAAPTPSTSIQHERSDETSMKHRCKVFLARVLVGKFVGGNNKMRKPPPLNPKADPFGKCYDSCVDNVHEPKIFVIFDSAQAYPEYLLEYTYD